MQVWFNGHVHTLGHICVIYERSKGNQKSIQKEINRIIPIYTLWQNKNSALIGRYHFFYYMNM